MNFLQKNPKSQKVLKLGVDKSKSPCYNASVKSDKEAADDTLVCGFSLFVQ